MPDRKAKGFGKTDAADLLVAGADNAAWGIAVWTVPARSFIALISLARSLVKTVADCLAREIPT